MKKRKGLTINIHLTNRWLYTFIAIGILIAVGVGVYAYGTNTPSTFGHSSGEIVEADPTVLASVKDGITWAEITSRPAGLDDGDTDTHGSLLCTHIVKSANTVATTCDNLCSSSGYVCVGLDYSTVSASDRHCAISIPSSGSGYCRCCRSNIKINSFSNLYFSI